MNILMLHGSSDLYGASKSFLDTVEIMLRQGHKVFVRLSEPGPLADELSKRGADVAFVRLGILRRKYYNVPGIVNRSFVLSRAAIRLARLIRKEKIGLIYSNTAAVIIGPAVAKFLGVKHIWHILEIIEKPTFFARFLAWAINRLTDLTIVVSGPVRDHWVSLYGKDTGKIRVIHNGIDVSPFKDRDRNKVRNEIGLPEDKILVGMIARVHFWKGQTYFLRIAGQIAKKYPNARFLMAGDAFPGYEYLYDEIRKTKEDLGIGSLVYDLGYRRDVSDILAALDLFILPSTLPDPLPTTVLEAMASARPVVATGHGGALEMVANGVTGFHIPWDDETRAFAILEPLMKDGDLRRKMGEQGFARVMEHFSPPSYEKNIVAAMKSIGCE